MNTLISVDKQQVTLRNLWRGCAAFLVGSGPSLVRDDPRLNQRGIAAMGINNAAALAPCGACVSTDPAEKIHHSILLDPNIIKFCPDTKLSHRIRTKIDGRFTLTNLLVKDCPNVFAFRKTGAFNPKTFLTEEKICIGASNEDKSNRPKCIFTMFAGLRLLHYLGVRRVYLTGMDFHMPYDQQYCGGERHPEEFRIGNQEKYVIAAAMLAELKPHFDATGFEIYNTGRESRLTVFPYVNFDFALQDCKGMVGSEPLDVRGWYDKEFKEGVYPEDGG